MRNLVVLLALSACSSSNLDGLLSFSANTETAGGNVEDGGVAEELILLIASLDQGSAYCGDSNTALNGTLLLIDLVSTPFVIPGSYPVSDAGGTGQVAFVNVVVVDDGGQTKVGGGVSGSVTLTQITPLTTGTFSATMVLADGGSGGDLSGSFNATFCGS